MANPTKGDVVRLKSGGPKMTIYQVQPDSYTCAWFDSNNKLQSANLPLATLEFPVEESSQEGS